MSIFFGSSSWNITIYENIRTRNLLHWQYKVFIFNVKFFFNQWLHINEPSVYRPLNSHGFTVCHTVSLPFSRSHGELFISHGFTNFEPMFSLTHSFLRKQTKAAHSNAAEENSSSMISPSSLSLSWALLLIQSWFKSRLVGLHAFFRK